MKTSVSVIAIASFDFKGRSYQPNQLLDVTPIDAVVLAKKRLITLTKRRAKAIVPAPVPEPLVEEPKKKRTYKRRDLQAEETAAMVPVEPEPASFATDAYDTYRDSQD